MKIAINCRHWLPGHLEGVGHFTQEVVRRWIKRHRDHEFILLFDRKVDLDFSEFEHVEQKILFPPARHPWLFAVWFEWSVPRALDGEDVDLFFSPEAFCSQWLKVPTVITVHDLAYLTHPTSVRKRDLRYYQKNIPRFLKKAEAIATVSHFSKRDIERQFPTLDKEVRVVYNGCREIFQPKPEEEAALFREDKMNGQPYFFYYGSLNPRKNIINLMQAFAHFKNENEGAHQLVLGGKKGWKTNRMKRVYEEHPFKDDIHFTGYLNDAQIRDWLTGAEALVYVSKFEGFGLPVLEAMQCGVPSITTKGSSMEEIAGDAAFYADATLPASISDAMATVIENKEQRTEKIKKGIGRASLFDWDKTAEELWAFIMEVSEVEK